MKDIIRDPRGKGKKHRGTDNGQKHIQDTETSQLSAIFLQKTLTFQAILLVLDQGGLKP